MSPEIRANGQLVADVVDETGSYQAVDGSPLRVDLSGIEARNNRQIVILEGPAVGGQRVVGLTQEGKGNSSNLKKGGDGKDPSLEVRLHDRPIRISYTDRVWINGLIWSKCKRTYRNPSWVRGHGRR